MLNKVTMIIMALFALLAGCSTTTSKSYFSHEKHGKLPASSPVVDKEVRSCFRETEGEKKSELKFKNKVGAPEIVASMIPVIRETDISIGAAKSATIFKTAANARRAIAAAKMIKGVRSEMLSCMNKKGWTPVK